MTLGVAGIAIGVIVPANPRPRHRSAVQRRHRAAAARGHHQGAGRRRGPRPRRQHLRRPAVGDERGAGPGRGLRRGGAHPGVGAGAVSDCGAAGVGTGPAAERHRAAHHGRAARRRRGQGAPAAAVLLRRPAARRAAEPGHQRHRQHPVVAVDDDQPAADGGADRRGGAGDDAVDLAAADPDHRCDGAAVAAGDASDRAPFATTVRRPVDQHRTPQRPHRGDLQRVHRGQDVRPPGGRARAVPRLQRRRLPRQFRRPVPLRVGVTGDDVHRQPQLRRGRRGRRPAGGDRADHARQHPGVHPVRAAVQPAAEPGRRDVQHPAVRGGQRRAGVRPARRARGAAGTRADAAAAHGQRPADVSSSSTSASATARAPR